MMSADPIRIEPIKVKDLPAFARQTIQAAEPGGYIAITQQRADALAANPLADPDDVGLLVAYAGEQLAGYFGIMTIQLQFEGERHKLYWFTTWSAAPEMRGKGVGSALMAAALALQLDFIIVGSAPARRVCAKFGFESLPPLDIAVLDFGLTGRYNPISLLARAARKVVNLAGGALDISRIDRAAARFFERWFGAPLRALLLALAVQPAGGWPSGLRMQRVERVREDAAQLNPDSTCLYRDARVVNWMLAHPWVLPPGASASEGLDYYFTDTRAGFEYLAYEVHQGEDYLGYMIAQISLLGGVRVLRILDVTVPPATTVLQAALRLAGEHRAQRIEMNAAYAQPLQDMIIYQGHQRIYQVHPAHADSPLARAWRGLRLDFADGDMAFT
jgi:GNAT superfamily N-acetyltransferase